MELDDKDFKQIDKALTNTIKGLAGLHVERDTLKGMLDDPSFAHRREEVANLLLGVETRLDAGQSEIRQIREKLAVARANHFLDRSKHRVADLMLAIPNLNKWLKRLTPAEGVNNEP